MFITAPAVEMAAIDIAAQLPASVYELAATAWKAEDEAALKAVFKLARTAWPTAVAQTDALEAEYAARSAEKAARIARAHADRLAAASPFDNWKGTIELGGAWSTGSTDLLALYGALKLEREGLRWQHRLFGKVDFQKSDGSTTADRYNLGWQPGYNFSENMFTYGLGQFEHDQFLGFSARYTLSTGIGVVLASEPGPKLSLTGGPAVRHTDYIGKRTANEPAGRAALAFRWKVTPTLALAQDASVFFESDTTSALSTTAVETALFPKLKARLSWEVQYEQTELADHAPIDTTSRATLVYSF